MATSAAASWLAAAGAAGLFVANILRFFPNAAGGVGYDYGLFLPWFVGGYFWEAVNGPWVPPEYLPSFCGGVPFLFNPQSVFWSVPQQMMAVMPPMESLAASWIGFGLVGAGGMYLLLRRVFATSRAASLVGAAIFLLNGFYTTRMIIGHVTFHGVMLLPLIAALLFLAPAQGVPARRRWAGMAARGIGGGLLLAYLFYSGGTNTILPMALAFALLALLLAYLGRWHRAIVPIALAAGLLCLALCAYKLLPALSFASHVVRPVSLRMTGNLPALVGGAGMSLFLPQALAWLPPEKLLLDRVEFEYGVGLVPLLAIVAGGWAAFRRGHLTDTLGGGRWWIVLAGAMLLAVPVAISWDALGLRWLVLHLPILKMMSVLLRFWFAYIPFLCVTTGLLLDYLVADPRRRAGWASAAIALAIAQTASTDMGYYATQGYDPTPLSAVHARVAAGGAVPAVVRIADPWAVDGKVRSNGARNDALANGTSDVPCYEPMFGYRMEVFRQGRLDTGPVLGAKGGLLNLKNPSCYTFPDANGCRPGDEFRAGQRREAEAFSRYRPFAHAWPTSQYVASALSLVALLASLAGLVAAALLAFSGRRRRAG
jgi:hypothetical protein